MSTVQPAAAAAKSVSVSATSSALPLVTLLALDLGKFKSVACVLDVGSNTHRFATIDSTPAAVHDLLVELRPCRLVIEA